MRRFISLLLIPLCLTGGPTPHAHVGSGAPESADHAARPHVHLSGRHGHSHGAEHRHGRAGHRHDQCDEPNQPPTACPAGDHDQDALYFADWSASLRSTAIKLPAGSDARAISANDAAALDAQTTRIFLSWRPPDVGLLRPLYVRLCALSI